MTFVKQKVPSSNQSDTVQYVEIDDTRAGQRIDNFLLNFLKGVPKTHIYRIIRKGEVRINKGRIKPVYKLSIGDIVRIPPIRVSTAKTVPKSSSGQLEWLKSFIIFEDKDLIILNKPSGMAVHGGSGINLGVIESMRQLMPREKRLELVHRLDRDTSGCLLIAKKASVLKSLHDMIRNDRMQKSYVALLKGRLDGGKLTIDAPLRKFVTRSGERIVDVSEDGKPSKTIFLPEQVFAQASLVNIQLITGRTHQIRVHSKHIDHPVAGDDKYGDKQFNTEMKSFGLKRLFLHARSLRFEHPATGKIINAVAPLDPQLVEVLDKLGKQDV